MEEKIERRIGTITCGICLILVGIGAILSMFTDIAVLRVLLRFWPLAIISLGIEMLVIPNMKNIKLKYDFLGIILVIIILSITFVASIASYTVDEIFFNTNFLENIRERVVQMDK